MMELKILPVLVATICALAMWGIAEAGIVAPIMSSLTGPLSLAVLVLGLATGIAAIVSFRRAGTTVNPMKPETATQLVSSGIYTLSRNPMYLGVLLILSAWAIWLGSALNVALLFLFVWYMTRFQIIPEERALEARFPEAFAVYKSRVRRWI